MFRHKRDACASRSDEKGNKVTITIEGALNVIERYRGRNLDELSEAEKKELGVAFHTVQDAEAHKGGKWAQGKEHIKHAKEMGSEKRHNLLRDMFDGKGGLKQSKADSDKAAQTVTDKTQPKDDKEK